MIDKTKTMLAAAVAGFLCGGAWPVRAENRSDIPYWQDVQVVAVNKEAPRSSFMTYADRAAALSSRYENSPYYMSLNGTWKFFFAESYKDLPDEVTDPAADASAWSDITVPGN